MKKECTVKTNPVTGLAAAEPRIRGEQKRPLVGIAAGVLLTCLGAGSAVLSFTTAISLPVPLWVLGYIIFVFPALFGVLFALKRAQFFLLPLLVAGYVACLWTCRTPFIAGLRQVVNRLFATFSVTTAWDFPQLASAPSGHYAGFYLPLFLLLALFPVVGLLSRAVAGRRGFFPALVLTVPFLAGPLAYLAMPAPWAAMGLLLFYCCLAFGRLATGPAGHTAQTALLCAPGLALCLGILYLLLPAEGYRRPPEMERLRVEAEQFAMGIPGKVTSGPLGQTGFLSPDLRRRPFATLGSASFSGQTALRVKVDGDLGGALYLKSFTGSVYSADGWRPLPDGELDALARLSAPIAPLNLTAALFEGNVSAVTVRNLMGGRGLYAPSWLVDTPTALPWAEFLGDADLRSSALLGRSEYTLHFLPRDADITKIHDMYATAGEALYAAASYDAYTEVPSTLRPVLNTALAPHHLPTPAQDSEAIWAAADLVKERLQFGTYTLTPGPIPDGRDFAAYFLAEGQRGFCVHFATAAVLMLRQLGVPARYAEGYVITPSDLTRLGTDGFADISNRRAHAWAEFYIAGWGWFPLDCTPGFEPNSGLVQPNDETSAVPPPTPTETPTPTAELSPAPTTAPSTAPTLSPAPVPAPAPQGPNTNGRAPVLLLWVLGPALAALVVLLRRRAVLALRRRAFAQRPAARAGLAAYALLVRLRPFVSGPISAEIILLAQKARFSQHGLTRAEVSLMCAYLTQQQALACAQGGWWRRFVLRYIRCLA